MSVVRAGHEGCTALEEHTRAERSLDGDVVHGHERVCAVFAVAVHDQRSAVLEVATAATFEGGMGETRRARRLHQHAAPASTVQTDEANRLTRLALGDQRAGVRRARERDLEVSLLREADLGARLDAELAPAADSDGARDDVRAAARRPDLVALDVTRMGGAGSGHGRAGGGRRIGGGGGGGGDGPRRAGAPVLAPSGDSEKGEAGSGRGGKRYVSHAHTVVFPGGSRS